MDYFGELLDKRYRADPSAYPARVNALETAAVVMWPRVLECGRMGAGAVVTEQAVGTDHRVWWATARR